MTTERERLLSRMDAAIARAEANFGVDGLTDAVVAVALGLRAMTLPEGAPTMRLFDRDDDERGSSQ